MRLVSARFRSLERKYWRFLGFIFFFEPEGRGFESLPARQILNAITDSYDTYGFQGPIRKAVFSATLAARFP